MADNFSDYLENKLLDHIFNDAAFTAPSPFLGLWTATSTLSDTSTGATTGEAAYTTYARVAIANSDMSAAASGSKTNSAAITFPAFTAGTPQTITQWAILDTATLGSGNILVYGTCTSTTISTTQTPPVIAIGGLVVTLA